MTAKKVARGAKRSTKKAAPRRTARKRAATPAPEPIVGDLTSDEAVAQPAKKAKKRRTSADAAKGRKRQRDTGHGGALPVDSPPRHRYDAARKKRVPVWVRLRTLDYEAELELLQIELLKLQNHVKAAGLRVVILFEGRDAAGKGGTIKRITDPLNPRGARVVALEKPSDRERTQWYLQRYVAHLPAAGEIVLFDRSWYNRAMVEPVMGFCSDEEHKRFMKDVPFFEQMLVKSGITLFKFYFSVTKEEQLRRFLERSSDLMKQYKISPVDQHAQRLWDAYTVKKFQMLTESNRTLAPWWIIRSDDKKRARLNCMRLLLSQMDYEGKSHDASLFETEPDVVISGIDELKLMEETLLGEGIVPG